MCAEHLNFEDESKIIVKDGKTLRAAFVTDKIWEQNSTLYIRFIGDGNSIPITNLSEMNDFIDPLQLEFNNSNLSIPSMIEKVINERIAPLINLNIVFTKYQPQDSQNVIIIGFNQFESCWSLIGTDIIDNPTSAVTMNFGWFDVATCIHEFCHALGMIHEHQNPNGEPIDWNVEKVYNWASETQGWDKNETYTNIIERYDTNQINGSDFDDKSIMLYFFPDELTNDGRGTKQNSIMSIDDIIWLQKIYPPISIKNPTNFYNNAKIKNPN